MRFISSRSRDLDALISSVIGDKPVIYFDLQYVPPYDDFDALDKLCEKVRGVFPPAEDQPVVVDITDWIGHQDEKYFEVAIKYLADRSDWDVIFVAKAAELKVTALLNYIRLADISVSAINDTVFSDERSFNDAVRSRCPFRNNALHVLFRLFSDKRAEPLRSHSILMQVMDSLSSGRKIVDIAAVRNYVRDERSVFNIVYSVDELDEIFTEIGKGERK